MSVATTQEEQPKMSNNIRRNEPRAKGKRAVLAEGQTPVRII